MSCAFRVSADSVLLVLVLGSTLQAGPEPTCAFQEPDPYQRARLQLEEGDTAAALAGLRELTRDHPDHAPGWGLLGRILAARASGVATDFRERREAEKALRQALRLDGDNALYLFTLGLLKRKQQIYLDARRLLNRAIGYLEDRPEELSPEDRAELWFQRGLFYEDEYLDTRHLVWLPELPVQSSDCATAATFCLNFSRPRRFNDYFRHAADLSEFGEDDFERTVRAFQSALDADPTHSRAFRRLAIHLIDRGAYGRALHLARRYRDAAPESPWGYITLGLIHQRTGRDSAAAREFERGLERAHPSIVAHYRDIAPLLRERQANEYERANDLARQRIEQVLWRKSDPLYLSDENEVQSAHLARVAYADLMFEDPSEGRWGSETERGQIYVRYGPPRRIWQVHRDAAREQPAEEAYGLMEAASDVTATDGGSNSLYPAGAIMFGPVRQMSQQGGGRWIFWNYGRDLPNFVFEKQLRWRHASHVLSSLSKQVEEESRERLPAAYATSFEIVDYPVQIARFRGAADSVVEIDLYSDVPTDTLSRVVAVDSLRAGLFVFSGADHTRFYERSLEVPARAQQALTYSLPLPPGRYTISLEARGPTGDAAVHREEIELTGFGDGLAVSDVVLADGIEPRAPAPTDRRDFALSVNRRLRFHKGAPLALYWEVYGLSADDDRLARYRVTISVTDVGGRDVLARVVGALGDVLGLTRSGEPRLGYERTVERIGDRIPEYVTLRLLQEDVGAYRVRVEVTDRVSGQTASAERAFDVIP